LANIQPDQTAHPQFRAVQQAAPQPAAGDRDPGGNVAKRRNIMKIKEKLTLGIIFLFVEFLVIALFSAYSIYNISEQSEKIMKDNNLSIQYAENMLQTIDRINALQLAVLFNPSKIKHENDLTGLYERFEENLNKEAKNVTEPGEKELLQSLTGEYKSYMVSVAEMHAIKDKTDFYFQQLLSKYHSLKSKIYRISDINMQAIMEKNESVNRYERRSYVILTIIASICFLLSIVFIFNFPSMITDPIRQLSESLKSISNRNYDIHLDFKSNGEFKEMENAIKMIVARLKTYEGNQPDAVSHERASIAATIDQTLARLHMSQEQIRNLDIKKNIDDQINMIEILRNELEQSKRLLKKE
jgi:nitrate/nitrite-specific signal transduction histidine kinase